MRKFDRRVEKRTLTLRWRKQGVLPALAVASVFTALSLWLIFLHRFVHGRGHEIALRDLLPLGATMLVVSAAYLVVGLLRLRPQTWELSRDAGTIILNGRLVYGSSEIKSVHLDEGFYDTGGSSTAGLILYLRTRAGSKMELAREGAFGVGRREMREIAEAISEQTGADIVLKDGFVGGWRSVEEQAEPARRWGAKRGRSVRRKRPKCHVGGQRTAA